MVKRSKFPKRCTLAFAVLLAALLSLTGCAAPSTSAPEQLPQTGVPAEKVEGVPAVPYVEEPAKQAIEQPGTQPEQPAEQSEQRERFEQLTVRFLDVGQGDAALITCADQSLLIDGGPSSASSKLYTILQDLGITHLDYIIATHPDADHCGGIAGALNAASCGTFYCSVTEHDTKTFQSIVRYLGTTPITVPRAGDSFAFGSATVSFVGPVTPTRDTNNGSLVCTLTYGDASFLFTGDAEAESESQMVASGADLDVDVLKVGHHGSDSSSTEQFLSKITPEYAVISVGKNSYGHPTDEALARLGAAGADILRTDELGTITFQTNGEALEVTASKGKVTS